MDMSLRKLWETVKGRKAEHAAVNGVAKSQTRLSDWTTMRDPKQALENKISNKDRKERVYSLTH